MPETGYLTEPDYWANTLWETVGYVKSIRTEMEGPRHAMFFTLAIHKRHMEEVYRYQQFLVYLDVGTTVAVTQLQLLRDAMWSMGVFGYPYLVRVHFNFMDSEEKYAFPYYLEVSRESSYPVSVEDFYDFGSSSWKVHLPLS
ncbi:MAG: hypothetical protein Q8P18_19300 [Pseudomonadota bacterium]|nr:hypothetical protein [Pseudomonadota bacterium]